MAGEFDPTIFGGHTNTMKWLSTIPEDKLKEMARTSFEEQQAQPNNNFEMIPERGEAIAYALSIAKKGDVIGFLGKGHEKSMSYQGFEHPWSDQAEPRV